MTSKISYFDRAVFLRALKKTAPVWALFTLYQLLLPVQLQVLLCLLLRKLQ